MRGKKELLLGCVYLGLFLLGSCLGIRFEFEKNNMEVTKPDALKGVYDSWIGWLGAPQYGGTLSGTVIYPEVDQKACKEFQDTSSLHWEGGLPTILLVDRGDCFFSIKTFLAQSAGAVAVLIVDDTDVPLISMGISELEIHGRNTDMLDMLHIPTALISKSLGDRLKRALYLEEYVTINLDLSSLSDFEGLVKYDLWMSVIGLACETKSNHLIEFVKKFREVAKMLEQNGYTKFTPHYVTWSRNSVLYGEDLFSTGSQCINHGRILQNSKSLTSFPIGNLIPCMYCVECPFNYDIGGYQGKDSVVQSLLQSCFFKVADQVGKPWLWWDYMSEFSTHCTVENRTYDIWCAEEMIQSLGIDPVMVFRCVGDPDADVNHPILDVDQVEAYEKFGTRISRILSGKLAINDHIYGRKLVYEEVLRAICGGIIEGKPKPALCPSEHPEIDTTTPLFL